MMKHIGKLIGLALLLSTAAQAQQYKSVQRSDKEIAPDQRSKSTILSNQIESKSNVSTEQLADPLSWNVKLAPSQSSIRGKNKFGGLKYAEITQSVDNIQEALVLVGRKVGVNAKSDLKIYDQWTDDLGQRHARLFQLRDGIKVYNSESILHIDGEKVSLQSNLLSDVVKLPQPKSRMGVEAIKNIVHHSLDDYEDIDHSHKHMIDGEQWEMEQVYYFHDDEWKLSWYTNVYANVGEHKEYIIDANTGEIIKSWSTICKMHDHDHSCLPPDGNATANASDLNNANRLINTYEVGNTFFLIDGSRQMFNAAASNMPQDPKGAIITLDAGNTSPRNNDFNYSLITSSNNTWGGKATAVSAHYNAGRVYEYFRNVHNRNSLDNAGTNIISLINVTNDDGSSMGNAFWNGAAMFYGNGDSAFEPLGKALDVAAHEISHGIVQNTANLEYQDESGALNESFADIFGAMVDRDDWQIGEDVSRTSAFPSGALRDMQDPHNGTSQGNFGAGWQPKHYNERFTGSQDNGGVHINSGIVNHAYYRFASSVGKDVAEKVYYRALTTYLTRSSNFADLRAAVTRAAQDVSNNDATINAINTAFDAVGIGNSGSTGGGGNQTNSDVNQGDQFIFYSNNSLNKISLAQSNGNVINDPLEQVGLKSRVSVSDDGSRAVFINDNNQIGLFTIDWNQGTYNSEIFDNQSIWGNVVISKDGKNLAAVSNTSENKIYVYNFDSSQTKAFELYNPTYSDGVTTGDVLYADALEFDISGQRLIYDAYNQINGNGGNINYWDIGIIDVWSRQANNFADGKIGKLFSALPEGVSIGNPTFSKNSNYIVAFDYISSDQNAVLASNLETNTTDIVVELSALGYPSYSTDDSKMIFDSPWSFGIDVDVIDLQSDKITPVSGSQKVLISSGKWGVWFANGSRNLYSDVEDVTEINSVDVYPNPATQDIVLSGDAVAIGNHITVTNNLGATIISQTIDSDDQYTLGVSHLVDGVYTINISGEATNYSVQFVKQ